MLTMLSLKMFSLGVKQQSPPTKEHKQILPFDFIVLIWSKNNFECYLVYNSYRCRTGYWWGAVVFHLISDIINNHHSYKRNKHNTGNSSINCSVSIKTVLLHDISNKYTLLIKNEQLYWSLAVLAIDWLD